ncbi:MAG: PorT family protein [Cytophagales bacterium]|nr:MAG: PorT family protein [Cytophagales bacterium]
MKKKIEALVIVCLLLWAGQAAFAQESKWRLGLKISPNISLLSVTDKSGNPIDPEVLNINKPTRIGFSGGLQVIYQFVEKFGLQTGLQVSTQGFTVNTRTFGNSENALQQQKINLVMLQVPRWAALRWAATRFA